MYNLCELDPLRCVQSFLCAFQDNLSGRKQTQPWVFSGYCVYGYQFSFLLPSSESEWTLWLSLLYVWEDKCLDRVWKVALLHVAQTA